ncbi:MAG: metallophosphoesterase family protein [Gemmatimonadaceae bacterium]
MRLVHLSDTHLGFRQYQRLTPAGINQREADVARTFKSAIDQIIALAPDLVLVAGDVFHTPRPSNAAILHAFRQFLRLRTELPRTHIVMVAGDHDTPRTSESGSIMGLFQQIGVEVAAGEPRRIPLRDLDASVLAVPDGPVPELTTDASTRHNFLVMHAHVREVVPQYYAELDRTGAVISRADLAVGDWDYVALGHYHIHVPVAKNAFYCGSLDYTSLNVWFDKSEEEEQRLKGKGFIEYDVDTARHAFHLVPASRDFLDLRPISARELSPAEVNAAIERAMGKVNGGVDDKVVRLVIRDIPRSVARELDHRMLREYKRRALHFALDLRKPENTRRVVAGAPVRRPAVLDVVREQLRARQIPPDLDRERLVDLGMQYLDEADAFPAIAPAAAPVIES